MDLIGTTGNLSNRSHRGVQHGCIASPDAQLAKVVCQLLCRVHGELSPTDSQPLDSSCASDAVYATMDDGAAASGACGWAPLVKSHNMNAISPTMAGWE